jgi:uncharacterized cofD-like protein
MQQTQPKTKHKLVVMGGGTGSFTILQALKDEPYEITSLVNMIDDGGSTGILRDELGVLPPGDVRQCLVALSASPKIRDLFNYRFEQGTFEGHAFGNLFLTALEKVTGSFAQAVETASEVLNVTGRVVPVTLDDARLVLRAPGGFELRGEGKIDVTHFSQPGRLPELSLEPQARLNPLAAQAIAEADLILIAPGDLYTSIGPLLVVGGMQEALKNSAAVVAYLCNLVVKPGQTNGLSVAGHAAEIERFAGSPILDYVIYNDTEPAYGLLEPYIREGETPVDIDTDALEAAAYQAMGRPLIAGQAAPQVSHDPLAVHRSFIRHDPQAIVAALREIQKHTTP